MKKKILLSLTVCSFALSAFIVSNEVIKEDTSIFNLGIKNAFAGEGSTGSQKDDPQSKTCPDGTVYKWNNCKAGFSSCTATFELKCS